MSQTLRRQLLVSAYRVAIWRGKPGKFPVTSLDLPQTPLGAQPLKVLLSPLPSTSNTTLTADPFTADVGW